MKHGIIVLAHNNLQTVNSALRILDKDNFVFVIHVDAKCDYSPQQYVEGIKNAKIQIVERASLNWAAWSYSKKVIECLSVAINQGCDYLHVLQGADLPLKDADYFDSFFEKHNGINFLDISFNHKDSSKVYLSRIKCKHYLVDNKNFRNSFFLRKVVDKALTIIQYPFVKLFCKEKHDFFCSALFSITREFAEFVVFSEKNIEKKYVHTLLAEEHWPAEFLYKYDGFKSLAKEGNLRCIDWKRNEGSSPHTFTIEDSEFLLNQIVSSEFLFARKFSDIKDMDIIKLITDYLRKG